VFHLNHISNVNKVCSTNVNIIWDQTNSQPKDQRPTDRMCPNHRLYVVNIWKTKFHSCARERLWCGIFHCHWLTASIKPKLLLSTWKLCFFSNFLFSLRYINCKALLTLNLQMYNYNTNAKKKCWLTALERSMVTLKEVPLQCHTAWRIVKGNKYCPQGTILTIWLHLFKACSLQKSDILRLIPVFLI